MREIDKLDELIASMEERLAALNHVRTQAQEVLENTEGHIDATQGVLNTLKNARQQAEEKKVSVPTLLPTLDRLRDLLIKDKAPSAKPTEDPLAFSPAEVVEKSKAALLEAGRPMKRGQLVRALEAKGAVLAGNDKNKNLGTILWRHPNDFVSIDGLGYWVKGVPLEGVYDPDDDPE